MFDLNNLINAHRNEYMQLPQSQSNQNQIAESTQTVNNLIRQHGLFYVVPQSQPIIEIEDRSIIQQEFNIKGELKEFLKESSIEEMLHINKIYNKLTILRNDNHIADQIGQQGDRLRDDFKDLDNIRIRRKERNQKNHGNNDDKRPESKPMKKYVRQFKNYITKMYFTDNYVKIVWLNIETNVKLIKTMNISEFGGRHPSPSIIQEKTTGRFYIYDNSCGRVHIYSSEFVQNPLKDKPLVSLNLNEQMPRQDPLLYLIECEHEFQWKSVLFVIGGHQVQKNKFKRPLRTIKVFEIKKREVTLTAALTIHMKYPRMNPIVFDISQKKEIYWQQETNSSSTNLQDDTYIFIMGGNTLMEFQKDVDLEYRQANTCCEYVTLKLILDNLNRAMQFTLNDGAINFGNMNIKDSLNIKYQNSIVQDSKYNHFHHASVVKIIDDVFQDKKEILIIGGQKAETLKLQAINQRQQEILFMLTTGKFAQVKSTNVWSASNVKYSKNFNTLFYFDDSTMNHYQLVGRNNREQNAKTCPCCIQ